MGAAHSRANRRGRRPRRPAEACADVLPRVTTRGDSRCRQHPRRGQDPSLRTEPLTPAYANPRAGHARPLPRGGPETTAHVNPAGVSISPSVGRGAPTPPRPSAANNSPCLPPWGKVAPQGRMRGRLPLPPIPGQTVGGGVPDVPETLRQHPGRDESLHYNPCLPRASRRGRRPRRPAKPSANGHPPGNHPQTFAHANLRAGHARPLPCGGPGTGVRVNPAGVSISPSVGRGALTPPRPPAAANNSHCLPPWGKVAPQGRMRGRLPSPPIPGQTVGGGVPDAPRNLAPTAIPGQPPANIRPRKPAGRACPAPTVQRNDQFYTTSKGGSHT